MAKKWYGSINNRIAEGVQYVKEIKVGDGLTEYLWSDRLAYEIVEVTDQEHIKVRRYNAVRIDKNGMSECQDYRFDPDPESPIIELQLRKGIWNKVIRLSKSEVQRRAKELLDKEKGVSLTEYSDEKRLEIEENYIKAMSGIKWTDASCRKYDEGKEVVRYKKWPNIAIGIKDEYYDYTF